nr:hypothetical protein [Tanacetum cinerariifolium]
TSKTLKESNCVRDSCLVALQTKQTEFEKYKANNDGTVDYDKLESFVRELKQEMHADLKYVESLEKAIDDIEYDKAEFLNTLHHMSTQMKDKVMPNNSQVKVKKTEVEDHPRIPSISNKTKSVTACNDNLKSRTSNVNAVCATCDKCLIDSNHFSCVTKMLNDVNARTKKPNVVPISTRKPKS